MTDEKNEKIILDDEIELISLGVRGYEIQIQFKAPKKITERFADDDLFIETK